MPVQIPIVQYIELGKIAQFLSGVDSLDDTVFKGDDINPNLERLLYIVRSSVERAFIENPADETLNATGEFLYSLVGKYIFSDLVDSVPGGIPGGAVFSEDNWFVIAFKVPNGSPLIGTYDFQDDRLISAENVVDLLLNKVPETIVDGDFTFDPVTGTVTRQNPFFEGDSFIIRFSKKQELI